MKKLITFLILSLFCFMHGYTQTETFTVLNTGAFGYSPDCDLSLDGGLEGNFFFDVNTISGVIGDNWIIDNIMIDIAHQNVGDLFIAMSVPANDKHLLMALNDGGTGNNFSNTIFAPYATTPISDGVAPFSGVYLPRTIFSFLDGSNVDGFWRLKVCDLSDNNISGVVLGASITFRRKCPPPTNLVVSNITNTTAFASWSPGGSETSWEVRFQAPSIPAPTYTTPGTPTSTPSVGLNAIPPGVNADFYVRAVCGGGSLSDWVKTSFTTTNICEPTSFESMEVVSTFFDGASFNWDTDVDFDWNIGLRNVTFGEPPFTNSYTVFDTYHVSSTEYSISGLQQANDYELWVQPDCATGTNNHWQGPFLFTTGTLVVCQGASNLGASNITQTEATLTWTPGGSTPVDAWNLEIVDLTAGETLTGTPTVSNLTSPTYTATGLIPDHEYQYDVQAVCGSASSGAFTFTTLAVGDCLDFTVYTTAGGWSNGVPDATIRAIFQDSYDTSLGNITACKLVVFNGATLTINAGEFVLVDNDITVETGSKIEVTHQGSILQVLDDATVTNNGTIEVNATTPNLNPRDFMLIGSPMTAEVREDLAGFRMLKHDTNAFDPYTASPVAGVNFLDNDANDWSTHSGVLNAGEGYYYIPGPDLQTGGSYNLTFNTGTLNNGVISYATTFGTDQADSPNIISNPYASAIDAESFRNANAAVNELYFWEHESTPSNTFPGANSANYNMEDISVFNAMGSDGVAPTTISTAQGFGYFAANTDAVIFNNSMRLTTGNTTLRSPDVNTNRMWLHISSDEFENIDSRMMVGFTDQATAGYDTNYDSQKLASIISLYSRIEGNDNGFIIQGREAFNTSMEIPLGFSSQIKEDTSYSISLSNFEGVDLESTSIYLIDNDSGNVTNLNLVDYSFTSPEGNFPERFTIVFENEVLNTTDVSVENVKLYPNPTSNVLNIVVSNNTINTIAIMDIRGRMVLQQNNNTSNVKINIETLDSAVYFVKIYTKNGIVTKRFIKE